MSQKRKLSKSVELTQGGFIIESSRQLRSGFTFESIEILDPYPDAYKVCIRQVTSRKKGKPLSKQTKEWLIARPMEGHIPKGGYDLFQDERVIEHYQTFGLAQHACAGLVEAFILSIIMKEPFLKC